MIGSRGEWKQAATEYFNCRNNEDDATVFRRRRSALIDDRTTMMITAVATGSPRPSYETIARYPLLSAPSFGGPSNNGDKSWEQPLAMATRTTATASSPATTSDVCRCGAVPGARRSTKGLRPQQRQRRRRRRDGWRRGRGGGNGIGRSRDLWRS